VAVVTDATAAPRVVSLGMGSHGVATSSTMKAALYPRVSTANGEQDPETQLHELRAWAHRRGLLEEAETTMGWRVWVGGERNPLENRGTLAPTVEKTTVPLSAQRVPTET
jgi:hypothetical protein